MCYYIVTNQNQSTTYIKLCMKNIALRTSLRMQTRHEHLWANKVVDLHYRLIYMNNHTDFTADRANGRLFFHVMRVYRLLSPTKLSEIRARISLPVSQNLRPTLSCDNSPSHSHFWFFIC